MASAADSAPGVALADRVARGGAHAVREAGGVAVAGVVAAVVFRICEGHSRAAGTGQGVARLAVPGAGFVAAEAVDAEARGALAGGRARLCGAHAAHAEVARLAGQGTGTTRTAGVARPGAVAGVAAAAALGIGAAGPVGARADAPRDDAGAARAGARRVAAHAVHAVVGGALDAAPREPASRAVGLLGPAASGDRIAVLPRGAAVDVRRAGRRRARAGLRDAVARRRRIVEALPSPCLGPIAVTARVVFATQATNAASWKRGRRRAFRASPPTPSSGPRSVAADAYVAGTATATNAASWKRCRRRAGPASTSTPASPPRRPAAFAASWWRRRLRGAQGRIQDPRAVVVVADRGGPVVSALQHSANGGGSGCSPRCSRRVGGLPVSA
jgi:hypothetical protein